MSRIYLIVAGLLLSGIAQAQFNPMTLVAQFDPDTLEDYIHFGGSLTFGDFDADSLDEFVIGCEG